jgi:polar amino acid transport system permease protein
MHLAPQFGGVRGRVAHFIAISVTWRCSPTKLLQKVVSTVSTSLNFAALAPYAGDFARGAWLTAKLAVFTSAVGVALGVAGALARRSENLVLRGIASAYVEALRNTPFLVQLFFIFFGLPSLGLQLTATTAATIALMLNLGAYSTEIIRAGIEAVPKAQWMAAASLGLSRAQAFLHVVLKPALANVWPALVSQLVLVMLGSAVVSQIAVEDLSYAADFVQGRNFRAFESYLVSTFIYLGLAVLMRQSLYALGRRVFAWRGVR